MADEKRLEGVYGENIPEGSGHSDKGIREETVAAHPQESDPDQDPSVAEALDDVRDAAAKEAGSGGMGRDGVPRNEDDATQGEFGGGVEEEVERSTPG